jgi:hypothetical protein
MMCNIVNKSDPDCFTSYQVDLSHLDLSYHSSRRELKKSTPKVS